MRTSVGAATEPEDGRRRFAFHILDVRPMCIVCMLHCAVLDGGASGGRRTCGERRSGRRTGSEWAATGLDRFQWNRRLGGAGGTCNGKRWTGTKIDWRLERRSRLMAKTGAKTGVVRCGPRRSRGGEREAEGNCRWKGGCQAGRGSEREGRKRA